jgi:hypothetical protein
MLLGARFSLFDTVLSRVLSLVAIYCSLTSDLMILLNNDLNMCSLTQHSGFTEVEDVDRLVLAPETRGSCKILLKGRFNTAQSEFTSCSSQRFVSTVE